jgi:hypothetical protein
MSEINYSEALGSSYRLKMETARAESLPHNSNSYSIIEKAFMLGCGGSMILVIAGGVAAVFGLIR